jgi:hypothetical protein
MLNYESGKKIKKNKPGQSGFTWLAHYPRYEIRITPQKRKQTNQEAKGPIS